jgi:hypothetical protein
MTRGSLVSLSAACTIHSFEVGMGAEFKILNSSRLESAGRDPRISSRCTDGSELHEFPSRMSNSGVVNCLPPSNAA